MLVARSGRGVPWIIIGLVGTGAVRAHITITLVVSLGVAYLLTSSRRRGLETPFIKLMGIVSLLAVFALVTDHSVGAVVSSMRDRRSRMSLECNKSQTSQDGSEFNPVAARSPVDLPFARFSVLFRPLPY